MSMILFLNLINRHADMMNIKEKIGQRIFTERKAKELTRKALAELTEDLKPSRINNWERGIRTPGPNEIKQLAKVFDISPAYLMCLTDNKQQNIYKTPVGALVPIINHQQASNPSSIIQTIKNETANETIQLIPIERELAKELGDNAFALKMKDDSMEPELKRQDILIIDPDQTPTPGDLVVALVDGNDNVVIRRYKQLSALKDHHEYELLATNHAWASIRIESAHQGKIIGAVIHLMRRLKA